MPRIIDELKAAGDIVLGPSTPPDLQNRAEGLRYLTRLLRAGLESQVVFFIQAVDTAGNVTVSGNKGHYFEPEGTDVYLPVILNRAAP